MQSQVDWQLPTDRRERQVTNCFADSFDIRRLPFPESLAGLILAALAAGGCATPAAEFDAHAARQGLSKSIVPGSGFRHTVYRKQEAQASDTLHVYFGDDGTPWTDNHPADDPTPRNPLVLQLLAEDPNAAVFVGRPCYHGLAADENCDESLWTSARYSEAVVESMAQATSRYAGTNGYGSIFLIGYSGGGVLATLAAPRLENVAGVITIAANLDIAAWWTYHRYDPLRESLNPADADQPGAVVRSQHLYGERDRVVPPKTADRYFEHNTDASRTIYPDYDHVCCWVRDWSRLLEVSRERLSSAD